MHMEYSDIDPSAYKCLNRVGTAELSIRSSVVGLGSPERSVGPGGGSRVSWSIIWICLIFAQCLEGDLQFAYLIQVKSELVVEIFKVSICTLLEIFSLWSGSRNS